MDINKSLYEAVDALIDELKSSAQYVNLENYNKKMKQDPMLASKIRRTREIREELSKMSEYDRNGDYAERLEEEYDNLVDNTAVHEFSLAELDFCSLYQDVLGRIVDSFDIDLQSR